jgi:hypothetical protein
MWCCGGPVGGLSGLVGRLGWHGKAYTMHIQGTLKDNFLKPFQFANVNTEASSPCKQRTVLKGKHSVLH